MGQPSVMARMTVDFLTWRRYLQKRVAQHDITLKQLYVLRQLVKRDFLYPSQLASMLFCDRPTATVIMKNMERRGWVTREQDPQNRKYIRISITEAGRRRFAAIEQSLAVEPLFDPLACFNKEEVKELNRLLGKLEKHLEKIGQEISDLGEL